MKKAMNDKINVFEREMDDFEDSLIDLLSDDHPLLRLYENLKVAFIDLKDFWEE